MDRVLKMLVFNGLKMRGNFDECLLFIEESLTTQEAEDLEEFFDYLKANKYTIGHGNIDKRWKAWKTERLLSLVKGKK
jgi:hypothetical protein